MKTKELIAEAISLPIEERALVVDSIQRFLNPPESEIEKKWIAVAKQRIGELKSGKVKAVPGDEVFMRIWQRFPK